jgi:hypothetical protein
VGSVTLDSSDVTAVEAIEGGVPEALVSVGGGTTAVLLSVVGGAPGLLASVDGSADETGVAVVDPGGMEKPEAGGAGGGKGDSVEAVGGTNEVLGWAADVEGAGAGTEVETGGAPMPGGGITKVVVAAHLVRVTVTVLIVVSRRNEGQLGANWDVRGEVSYHEVPEHGWLHQRDWLHLLCHEDQQLKKTSGMFKRRILWKGRQRTVTRDWGGH